MDIKNATLDLCVAYLYDSLKSVVFHVYKIKKEAKDQESIQSSTTRDCSMQLVKQHDNL